MKKLSLSAILLMVVFLISCSSQSDEPIIPNEDDVISEVETSVSDSSEADVEEDLDSGSETDVESDIPDISQGEAHENFQHIANSLTRYLIKEYDEVAIVENCPGGYEYNELYDDYICADYDDRWLEFEWLDGLVVKGPVEAGLTYLGDRTNPGGSSFQYSVDPKETYWTYIWYRSDETPVLHQFNMRTGEDTEFMSFYKTGYSGCEDGIRFIGWNDSGDKFALVSGNTTDTDLYPDLTKIFVLTIDGNQLLAKDKYSLPLAADCSANNGPFFMAAWYDDDTIGYYLRNYEVYDNQMDDFWRGNRWGSVYAEFLNL